MNKKNFSNITLKDFSPKSIKKDKNVFFETDEQIKIKSNYYSKKLTSETPNEEAKIDLAQSLNNLGISINKISEQMISMDTPKYARLNLELNDAKSLINSWLNI